MKENKLPKVKIKKIDEKNFNSLAEKVKKILKEEREYLKKEKEDGYGNSSGVASLT